MSFIVDEPIEEYAERHTTSPDPLLAELAAETKATMSAPQMLTGPIEGRFLELLVAGTGAKRVLEIGTFTGYSALSMAAAMPEDGRIDTLDIEPKHAEVAQRYFDRSPDGRKIRLHLGPALETIDQLEGEFDFVFIDADKENYDAYFEAVLPRLVGGRPDRDRQHALERARARPARRDDEADRGAERQARGGRPHRRRPADGAGRRHADPPPLTGHGYRPN